jgi:hypothetical protein
MLARCFGAIVDFCIRHAPVIIAITAILGLGSAVYVERHFGVNSNFDRLLSPNLPWAKRDAAYKATTSWQRSASFGKFGLAVLETCEHVVSEHWYAVALVCKFFAASYRDFSSAFFWTVLRLSNIEMDARN